MAQNIQTEQHLVIFAVQRRADGLQIANADDGDTLRIRDSD